MNKTTQRIIVGLLSVIVILQLILITKVNAMKPKPKTSKPISVKQESPSIPSLEEIDDRIRHWTMLHGQHFSATSRVSSLQSNLETRLGKIEKKIDSLAKVEEETPNI
jgi:hypothetical protein